LPTCYSPVRHSIHPPKGALIVRLACVKHAASVHPEPGSNSPLKTSQTEVCDSRRVGSGDPGSDESGHQANPARVPLHHSFVRTDRSPVLTGFTDPFARIRLLACHSIQFSRFRRSGGLHYAVRVPLSMRLLEVLPVKSRLSNRPRRRRTPPCSRRRPGGHARPSCDGSRLPDRLLEQAVYQAGTPFPKVLRRKAAWIRYHPRVPRARGDLVFVAPLHTRRGRDEKPQLKPGSQDYRTGRANRRLPACTTRPTTSSRARS
jgi:hypothetical protein